MKKKYLKMLLEVSLFEKEDDVIKMSPLEPGSHADVGGDDDIGTDTPQPGGEDRV